jgi:hypothetical protein
MPTMAAISKQFPGKSCQRSRQIEYPGCEMACRPEVHVFPLSLCFADPLKAKAFVIDQWLMIICYLQK